MKKNLLITLILIVLMSVTTFAEGESGSIISSGYGNTYVIKNDASLWGSAFQFVGNGKGSKEEQTEFVKILDNVKSVSSGGSRVRVAVKKDGTLWGWGDLKGYPDGSGATNLKPLYPIKLDIQDVKMASANNFYILVLKNDNSLWICGDMYLGNGTFEKAETKKGFEKITDNVIDMFADQATVFYLKEDHTLWGYGDNRFAQLANMQAESEEVLTPVKILDDVKRICTNDGSEVVGAIRLDNSLYLWGIGGFYTQELGWIEDAASPYKVMDDVKKAVVDSDEALIIKGDNSLWRWGYSYEGESISDKQSPYKVTDDVLNVTIGERHAAVLKTDYTLWTMGGDYRGGLGYSADAVWYTPLTKVFDDVQDAPASWAYEEVEKAIGEQLIPEDMQNNYTKPITREEFCILAIKMIEIKSAMSIEEYLDKVNVSIAPKNTFSDCDTKEVLAAKVLGITDGVGEGKFAPDKLLNREQAAKFLTTTAMACGRNVELGSPNYVDLQEIADWAKPYTGYVYDINVMKGVGSNRFDPQGSYQRQQAFMTMYRIWQAIDSVHPENVELSQEPSTIISEGDHHTLQSLEKELNNEPYPTDFVAYIEGTSTDKDGVTKTKYDIYYRDADIRIDTYYGDKIISNAIFSDASDMTYTVRTMGTHYAERLDGNWLPLRFLNTATFEMLENDQEVDRFEWRYETLDSEEVIYTKTVMKGGVTTEQWYSTAYKMPVKFHQEWIELDDLTVIEWKVSRIDETVVLEKSLFDIPSDVELQTNQASYSDEALSGDTRSLLLYEVKSIEADEAGTDGMMTQVFYYSDASYDMLVSYFKNLLKGTTDYSVYVQEGRTSIDGTINGEMVVVIVNDYMTTEEELGMNGVNVNYYE